MKADDSAAGQAISQFENSPPGQHKSADQSVSLTSLTKPEDETGAKKDGQEGAQ